MRLVAKNSPQEKVLSRLFSSVFVPIGEFEQLSSKIRLFSSREQRETQNPSQAIAVRHLSPLVTTSERLFANFDVIQEVGEKPNITIVAHELNHESAAAYVILTKKRWRAR